MQSFPLSPPIWATQKQSEKAFIHLEPCFRRASGWWENLTFCAIFFFSKLCKQNEESQRSGWQQSRKQPRLAIRGVTVAAVA